MTDNGNTMFDEMPSWSLDGTWIAFVSEHEDLASIYVIRHDGTGLFHLAAIDDDIVHLGWLP